MWAGIGAIIQIILLVLSKWTEIDGEKRKTKTDTLQEADNALLSWDMGKAVAALNNYRNNK